MIVLIGFAFLSGLITIISPCILPVLPIILASAVGQGKARPYGIITGFILSYSFITLALSFLVSRLGLNADTLRYAAIIILALFGIVMIIPALKTRFQSFVTKLTSSGKTQSIQLPKKAGEKPKGFWAGLVVGISLGMVWAPCAGPIMASVISLAATAATDPTVIVDPGSIAITFAYTLGTSIPMLAILLGGRALLNKFPKMLAKMDAIQKVFGIIMVAVAAMMFFGIDRKIQTALLDAFPSYGDVLTNINKNEDVQKALAERQKIKEPILKYPGIVTTGEWLGSPPLSTESLKGKVVLFDFWTYSCINCVRTLPHLRALYEKYKDQGLIIIGVHTPEFAFERDKNNVLRAMQDLEVTWPVVQDNDYQEWNAFNNRYWPAHYLIDGSGTIRYTHFGEGNYQETEEQVQKLLAEQGNLKTQTLSDIKDKTEYAASQETYLGKARAKNFNGKTELSSKDAAQNFVIGPTTKQEWSLGGFWKIQDSYIEADKDAKLELSFEAKTVFLVAEPPKGAEGQLKMDLAGKNTNLKIDAAKMYTIVSQDKNQAGKVIISVSKGTRLFAFTFGG